MPFVSKPGRFDTDSIIPGRTSDPDGFVTENHEYETPWGPRVHHFSVAGLRQIADRYPQVGLVRAEAEQDAVRVAIRYKEEAEALRAERDELQAKLDRISGLTVDGFKVTKVQGRPAKQRVGA